MDICPKCQRIIFSELHMKLLQKEKDLKEDPGRFAINIKRGLRQTKPGLEKEEIDGIGLEFMEQALLKPILHCAMIEKEDFKLQ